MRPQKLTRKEREQLLCSEKEVCLYDDWEECVVRVKKGRDSHNFIKFQGEDEFNPQADHNIFSEAMIAGDLITREEYDNY